MSVRSIRYLLQDQQLAIAIRQKQMSLEFWVTIFWDPDLDFHLHINRGAGAFVCGEGSALTASIEGKRGMPACKTTSYR